MTTYTWPTDLYPNSSNLTWESNAAIYESPLSGTVRTESRPGSKWVMSMTFDGLMYDNQTETRLHRLETLIYKLNGPANRIMIPDFAYRRRSTAGSYNPGVIFPSVFGAGQVGVSLVTNGWAYSTTVLYAGDRIGVSGQMIPLAADAVSNGSGFATLTLAHPVRDAPTNGEHLILDFPTAMYILSDNQAFSSRPGIVKTTTLTFREAIV